jgi:hypothetical protein
MSTDPQGIDGLAGRVPIGVVLSIGVKDSEKGFPTQTDRFHLVSVREEHGVRKPHPAFNAYNAADPEKRKIIRGNIVHGTPIECWGHQLKAQVLPKQAAHPDRRPHCVGDGKRAIRWIGPGPQDFKDIECPHERCEFRQRPAPTKPCACKPFARFIFRLRWPDGRPEPTMLAKFTTGSWHTVRNFIGFFEYLQNTASQLGLQNWTLFGMPFAMTLTKQTKPSEKTAFPVVTISPEIDPIEFFMKQRENIRQLAAPVPYAALTDREQQEPRVVAADLDTITVGIPAR